MSRDRRPSPELQVRAALEHAKRAQVPTGEAWLLATSGNVCDSYTSARGGAELDIEPTATTPPNLRAANPTPPPADKPSGGQKRCAGCRFVEDAGEGVARCTLYDVPVYSGVLWPHRTAERHEWQAAILGTEYEWRAAYDDEASPVSLLLDMLAGRNPEDAPDGDRDPNDSAVRSNVAA